MRRSMNLVTQGVLGQSMPFDRAKAHGERRGTEPRVLKTGQLASILWLAELEKFALIRFFGALGLSFNGRKDVTVSLCHRQDQCIGHLCVLHSPHEIVGTDRTLDNFCGLGS